MSGFSHINLSKLPKPDVVEELDFQTIKRAMLDDLARLDPEFHSTVLESDPAIKILEVCAYHKMLLLQRINEAVRAVMLASSGGTDLDHLAAFYAVERQILDPGDPDAVPPIPPTREDDDAFRQRIQLAPEAMTTAGSRGSYIFHTLSAGETATTVTVEAPEPGVITVTHVYDPSGFAVQLKDATAVQTNPGEVAVTVLSWVGNGKPGSALVAAVEAHLDGRYVRPLTDKLIVRGASILDYEISGTLELYDGPDAAAVLAEAEDRARAYADRQHRLGDVAAVSGIKGALHVAGVKSVNLTSPAADVSAQPNEAPYCTGITLGVAP